MQQFREGDALLLADALRDCPEGSAKGDRLISPTFPNLTLTLDQVFAAGK
ncbi:MAG: hypothetical protein F6K58_17970 [Symploca sp. SIO2E9]|nr:hypothetical protein [Symploca sp. SIO2E9]